MNVIVTIGIFSLLKLFICERDCDYRNFFITQIFINIYQLFVNVFILFLFKI